MDLGASKRVARGGPPTHYGERRAGQNGLKNIIKIRLKREKKRSGRGRKSLGA